MSVGALPYGGGLLHVGPVECMSCNSGNDIDDGTPDDPTRSNDRLDVNAISFDNDAANGDYQFPSPREAQRLR